MEQIAVSKHQASKLAQETLNLVKQHEQLVAQIRTAKTKADIDEMKLKHLKTLNSQLEKSQALFGQFKLDGPTNVIRNYVIQSAKELDEKYGFTDKLKTTWRKYNE